MDSNIKKAIIQTVVIAVYYEYGIEPTVEELGEFVEVFLKTNLSVKQMVDVVEKHAQDMLVAIIEDKLTSKKAQNEK